MLNKKFLSTLTLLYIEDDKTIQTSMYETIKALFKDVLVASDGEEGLELYKKNLKKINIIVSDISMPKLNGIDMLKEIREVDKKVPVIFATAHADSGYLLEAIKLNVSDYLIKPYILNTLLLKIEHICEELYNQKVAKRQRKELEQYLDVIDKVAIISKTDLKGNITFVNDIFCEIAGYDKNELIGKPHNIVRHPDMPSAAFKGLWDDIKKGKIWKGKVKNRAKDGEPYYVNATILPIFDSAEEIEGYMGIRFLTTEEESERREFKRKVLSNIQEYKKRETDAQKEINTLREKLKKFEHVEFINDALENEKKKNSKQHSQILFYEDEISKLKNSANESKKESNKKIFELAKAVQSLQTKNKQIDENRASLQLELESRKNEFIKINTQIREQAKIIEDLRDVIDHREEQLGIR